MVAASSLALVLTAQSSFLDQTGVLGLSLSSENACWADLNKDTWPDLVAGGAVWINERGKSFSRLCDMPSVVAGDCDNDGYPDLFSWQSMKLWHNDGGKTFTEVSLPALALTVSRGACWGDWNNDGLIDLYVGGFENWETQTAFPDFMLTNKGPKGFELTWSEVRYRARGVTACDFDADGDLDVYVSNYRLQPNVLWVNDGKGTFTDEAQELGAGATSDGFPGGHSIGAAWADFDNDGVFDLFAGNFAHVDSRGDQPKSRFLQGQKGGPFVDRGPCGVFYQESYASPAAGDFDNDGRTDLYFTTVYPVASFNRPNHPVLSHNDGTFAFSDVTQDAGLAKLGATYQAAWADFDRDGDLDLVTDGKLFVNQSSKGHWLHVRLVGDGKRVNRSAIGAQVRVTAGTSIFARHVEAGTGEGNQNDLTLHFGLGDLRGKVDLDVLWPGGRRQKVRGVKIDTFREVALR